MRRSLPALALALALTLGCGGAMNETNALAKFDRAIELEEQGAHEQALLTIDAALALNGLQGVDLAEAHTVRGNILNELDRYEEAVDAHQASLDLDPNQANVWTNLGVVHRLMGDYGAAQECYEKAMALDPTYPEVYASLGSVLLYQGQVSESLKILDQGVSMGSGIAIMHSNRAVALAYAGRFEEARASLKEGVALGYPNEASVRGLIEEIEAGGDPLGIRPAP